MCGRQAIDGDTAQVGPQIAEKLHLPQVTYAADIQKDGDTITVKRMLEDGYMTIKVQTPCLLTCIKELNDPRYMSIGGILSTYSKPLTTLGYEDLKDRSPDRRYHHRPEGLSHQHLQELHASPEGCRHDAGGRLVRRPARSWPAFWPRSTSSKEGDTKIMSNFNSADIAAFKDVWVFCEQREGKLMPTDFELISKGRDLADELGVNLCGLLLGGEGIESAAKELGGYGADKVIVCESPLLATYTTDAYAKVICDVIEDLKPEAFLIGATNIGRDLGPRCAARLHTGLCADCTHLDVDVPNYIQFLRESSTLDVDSMKWDMEDRNLKMTRPAFGGHLMATIICPRFRPCMATVRPGVMKKNAFDEAKANAVEIVKPNFTLTAEDIHTDVTEVVKAAKKLVDLIGADLHRVRGPRHQQGR